MKSDKKIEQLKNDYMNIEIPDKLNSVVNDALNKNNTKSITKVSTLVASLAVVVGIVNINPTFANALENIPVIGEVIKVINFRNYKIDEGGLDISIDVPNIEGMKDTNLQYQMNKEFEEEGKKLYDQYLKELEQLKLQGEEGRESFKSWYEVKTDNDDILSIVVYNNTIMASSDTTRKFYNIDKKNQTVLTLEGMFGGTDYVDIISENIKQQMRERMKSDSDVHYWIDTNDGSYTFDKIDKNQGFYINDKGKIVICFDKYEVAPGSQGLTEFVIPKSITDKLMK